MNTRILQGFPWIIIKFFFSPNPELFFLRWFITIGLLVSFTLPPFMGPDEATHVYRVYELSSFDLKLDKFSNGYGYKIPDTIIKLNQDQFSSNANQPAHNVLAHNIKSGPINAPPSIQYFENASTYLPTGYLHMVITASVSKVLGLSAYTSIMLMRLTNLAVCGTLVYLAIKTIPKKKWFFVMVGLFPMAIHQTAVITPDGIVNSVALLSIAMVAMLIYNKRPVDRKYLIGLLTMLTIASLTKQAYVLLSLILFLIPASVFRHSIIKLRYIAVCMLVILSILGLYNVATITTTNNGLAMWRQRDGFGETKTANEFVNDIVHRPVYTLRFLTGSFVYNISPEYNKPTDQKTFMHNEHADFTAITFYGSFGSLNIKYPAWITPIVLLGLLIPLLSENYTFLKERRERLLIWFIILSTCTLLTLLLWFKWTARTDPAIVGLQGRYFIPLLGLLVFVTTGRYVKVYVRKSYLPKLLGGIVFIEGAMMLVLIFSRFYAGP